MVKDTHLDILVHPLVLLNLSDYWNRSHGRWQDGRRRVTGICLGRQIGRQISIETTFELPVPTKSNDFCVDWSFLNARLEQYKQVFPNLEIIGWFTVAEHGVTAFEFTLQTELSGTYDNLLVVQLNRAKFDEIDETSALDLPLTIWDTAVEVSDGGPGKQGYLNFDFIERAWRLETSEVERIAVDYISKAQTINEDVDDFEASDKALISHYTAQANAIKMLVARIALLKDYVSGVKNGTVKADHDLLRQINALLQRLPVMKSSLFLQEFTEEQGDVLLVQHLNEIMKGTRTLSELIEMHATIKPKSGSRGGAGWM